MEENVFKKFINFIKKILGKEEVKQIPERVDTKPIQEQKANIFDELRVTKEENTGLLKLQNQYENNEIELNALSDDDIYNLNELYNTQIADLKAKLADRKKELTILQNQVNSYSTNM